MAPQRTLGKPATKATKPTNYTSTAAPARSNRPVPQIRPYVPKAPQGELDSVMWLTDEAKMAYDANLPRAGQDYYAWIPMPMFDSQLAQEGTYKFCPARFPGNEGLFNEWAYYTSLVVLAGTARKTTFCPLTGPGDSSNSREFISSPYIQFQRFVYGLHKERPFARATEPGAVNWCELVDYTRDSSGNNHFPKISKAKDYYLMLSIMLREVKTTYNREQEKRNFETREYFNPEYLGKGLGPDNEKLTVVAVSRQIWRDLTAGLNARNKNGEIEYPNPCDPNDLAVFYAWEHKKSLPPIPDRVVTTQIDGHSGGVSGVYFRPNKVTAGKQFALPQKYVEADGAPSDAYFEKVPIHIGETIRYMSASEQLREMARAFADAKSLLDISFAGTQFAEQLEDPAIAGIFAQTQQRYIYDSSVHAGAPTSVPVTMPAAAPLPPAVAPETVPAAVPAVPAPTARRKATPPPPVEEDADEEVGFVPLPLESEIWEDDQGWAMNENDVPFLHPVTGEQIKAADIWRKIEQQNWDA